MKLILSILIIAFHSHFSMAQPGVVVDRIAAQIGDNIILLSDIEAQKQQAVAAGMEITPNMTCEVLEELMYQQLLINQAKLDSLVVSDEQVDAEMENRIRVIENQIGSRQKMEEFYGKSVNDIKNEFRTIIRERLMANEMERKITADISVTPKEAQEFYATIPEDSIPLINAQLSFQQIVNYPEITKEDKKLAYEKLQGILDEIRKGKSFETQARIHSMDPGSAPIGGKIEATRGMMVPSFEATVFSLSPAEVSPIFESPYGYHIVKLLSRKGDDYTCQHILIIPEFSSSALEKAAYKMDSCYALLRNGSITWSEAVQRFSNDDATRFNDGIITNPITGDQLWDMEDLNQVDQQIFLLTDAMEKGDVSQPNLYMNYMDRQQGIRVVRLKERTEPHRANLKQDYALIKRAAENDKKQRIINQWVKSKIGNAYIRIDDSYKSCSFKNQWVRTAE
jgi:peptidyl-prolyl cis-trans isomerase SurA